MKRGFTLIELSIVLVIIGLLIGGILVAQSMVSAAKLTGQVQQIVQFDGAVMNFKEKYNYLPGDAPAFGGDGDGTIDRTLLSGDEDSIQVFQCELANFWANLMPDTYKTSACNDRPTTILTGPNKNVPIAKMGKPNTFLIASGLSAWNPVSYYTAPGWGNYYAILDPEEGRDTQGFIPSTSLNSPVKPLDLMALDKKIDDGKAASGYIIAGAINNSVNGYGAIVNVPLSSCSNGDAYTTTDTYECTPLIRIGGSAGDPQ